MRPKDDHLAARFHRPAHLAQNLHDLLLGEMFDHTQVISTIKAAIRDIVQIQNVAMADGLGPGIVSAVRFEGG